MKCPECGSRNIEDTIHKIFHCLDCYHTFTKEEYDKIAKTMLCPNCKKECGFYIYADKTKECWGCGYKIAGHNNLIKSRKELVKELASKYEYLAITNSEIIDEMIDIGLYNQKLKKKRRYHVQ